MGTGLPSNMEQGFKDRMITEMSIENKRMREELTKSKAKVFQLEADLDYLRSTVEENLPFFNKLEEENKTLRSQLLTKSQTVSIKNTEKLQTKIRTLEKKHDSY